MCGRTHTFLVSAFINIYENDIRNPLPQIRIKSKHEKSFLNIWKLFSRATDGVRTRDPDLGKVVLYQLSHCRISVFLYSVSEQYILYYKILRMSTLFEKLIVGIFVKISDNSACLKKAAPDTCWSRYGDCF